MQLSWRRLRCAAPSTSLQHSRKSSVQEELKLWIPRDGAPSQAADDNQNPRAGLNDDRGRAARELGEVPPRILPPLGTGRANRLHDAIPHILKARALSKAWNAKFQAHEIPEPIGDRALSPFLKQVVTRSVGWQAFCPAFVTRSSYEVVAYNRRANGWQKMHSLGYLPQGFSRQDLSVEGSLVCGSVFKDRNVHEQSLYVTNVLTRALRVLPPAPSKTSVGCKHLVLQGMDGYSVVVFGLHPHHRRNDPHTFDAQVYSSKVHAWRTTKVTIEHHFYMSPHCCAHANQTLYIVSRHGLGALSSGEISLLSLNVEDLSWEMFPLAFLPLHRPCTSVTVVLCGGQIVVTLSLDVDPPRTWLDLWDESHRRRRVRGSQQSLLLMRVDLKTRQLGLLSQGPPEHLCSESLHNNPVTDGARIYFGAKDSHSFVAYHVERDEWSAIPSVCSGVGIARGFQWSAFSFRPGLNSFLHV